MEKELNLVELLKDAPKGTKLYSPIFGECELESIDGDLIYVRVSKADCCKIFLENGKCYDGGECLLFPSKDNRDWSTFKVEKETADFKINSSKDKMALYIHAYLTGREMNGSVEVALSKVTANFDYAFSLIVSAVSYGLLRRAMVESEIRHLKAVLIKNL